MAQAYGNCVVQKEMGNIKCECQVVRRRSWCQQDCCSPGTFPPRAQNPPSLNPAVVRGITSPSWRTAGPWTSKMDFQDHGKEKPSHLQEDLEGVPLGYQVALAPSEGENQSGSDGDPAAPWVCTCGVCGCLQRTFILILFCLFLNWIDYSLNKSHQ